MPLISIGENMRSGQIIKELRLKMGLTQASLADIIGCKANTISQYEHNKAAPSIKIAKKIVETARTKKIKINLENLFPDE